MVLGNSVPIVCFIVSLAAGTICKPETDTVKNETSICETRLCSKLEYYDKLKQKCRDFPGGGYLVIMDHSTKCAHGDSGLHTFSRRDYYYVCNPEGVMIGLCPDNMVFSDTEKRCIVQTTRHPNTIRVHDEAQNGNIVVPECNGVGLFPIPSNCSFYFKCQEHNYNFHQFVYQCPAGTFFHPDLQKCSSSNKCYDGHEDILYRFNPDYFPECLFHGQFRTAKDCTLYYRCVPNMDGSFYQIRYECPYKMYYNIEREVCLPDHFQYCDSVPYETIIQNYKLKHNLTVTSPEPKPTTVISALNTRITSILPTHYETTQPIQLGSERSLVEDGFAEDADYAGEITTEPINYGKDALVSALENANQNSKSSSSATADDSSNSSVEVMIEIRTESNESQSSEARTSTEVEEVITETITDPAEYDNEPNPEKETKPPICSIIDCDMFEFDNEVMEFRRRTTTRKESSSDDVYGSSVAQTQSSVSIYDIVSSPSSPGYGFTTTVTETVPDSQSLESNEKHESSSKKSLTDSSTDEPGHSSQSLSAETSDQNSNPSATASAEGSIGGHRTSEISTTSWGPETSDPLSQYSEAHSRSQIAQDDIDITCNSTSDGEIMCNGQKVSSNGHLEVPGYEIKFRKWQTFPDRDPSRRKPKLTFLLTLEYPHNYVFEAYAKDYQALDSEPELEFPFELTTTNYVQNDDV